MERTRTYVFPRQEPGAAGHLPLVESLRDTPERLRALLAGVPEEGMRRHPGEGGWSMIEVAGHLRNSAEVQHQRLHMMSTQHDPVLPAHGNEGVPDQFADADVAEVLADIARFRADTVSLLTTLVNWNWARSGRHPTRGRLSIRQYVEWIAEHDAEHLAELARLRDAALAAPTA